MNSCVCYCPGPKYLHACSISYYMYLHTSQASCAEAAGNKGPISKVAKLPWRNPYYNAIWRGKHLPETTGLDAFLCLVSPFILGNALSGLQTTDDRSP